MTELEVKLTPRTDRIAELVEECANNEISFADLCKEVHEMGFKTTSLYEIVRAKRILKA